MKRALKRLGILALSGFCGAVTLSLSLALVLFLIVAFGPLRYPAGYNPNEGSLEYLGALIMALVSLPIGLTFFMPGTILFGPPLWWLLNRYGLDQRRYFIAIGAIAGAVAATILITSFTPISLAAGVGGAVAGWIIWTLDRPS